MERQPKRTPYDNGYLSLGVGQSGKEPNDAMPTVTSMILAGDYKENSSSKSERAAAAGNCPGAAVPCPLDDCNQEGGGGYGPKPEQGQEEVAPAAVEGPQPRERVQRRYRTSFTMFQWQELEHVYHSSRYPDVFVREEIARHLHFTEAGVQIWLQSRRIKWKRLHRGMVFRNISPIAVRPPVGFMVDRYYNSLPVPEPVWRYVPGIPQPVRPAMPPGIPMPAVLPVPPYGVAPVGMAWAPVIYGHFIGPFF